MGGGEYNNLRFYMQDTGTEIGSAKEIEITMPEEEPDNTVSLWDGGTLTFNLTTEEVVRFKRRFFPETLNNYRKLHGMPLRRKH